MGATVSFKSNPLNIARRKRRSHVETIEEKRWKTESLVFKKFPDALPGLPDLSASAFGVRKTALKHQLILKEEVGLWLHNSPSIEDIPDPALRGLMEGLDLTQELPVSGQISKCHDLTLDDEGKRAAKIPEDATRYCWGNPIFLSDTKKELVLSLDSSITHSYEVGFFLYGGFMYLAGNEILQCNSLVPANDGLFFGKPITFHTTKHRKIQRELALEGRFQDITILPFRERGAKFFCWLLPGEFELSDHGGFLYLFGDDMNDYHEQDRFFRVLGGSELQVRLQEVSKFLPQGILDESTGSQGRRWTM